MQDRPFRRVTNRFPIRSPRFSMYKYIYVYYTYIDIYGTHTNVSRVRAPAIMQQRDFNTPFEKRNGKFVYLSLHRDAERISWRQSRKDYPRVEKKKS